MWQRSVAVFFMMLALMVTGIGFSHLTVPLLAASRNGEPEWTQVGPDGGTMFDISVDPHDPARLYARSRAGIHRSLDSGASWELVVNDFVIGGRSPIVVDPTDSLHLMTVNDNTGNIHASEDGGTTWSSLQEPFGADGIVFDPVVNGRVWAFTENEVGGVYRSTTHGATWEPVLLPGFNFPDSMLAHPTLSNTLYVEAGGQVYRSSNGGDTWAEGGTTGGWRLAAMSESAIYAIYDDIPPSSPAILRSTDNGTTWEPFSEGLLGLVTSVVIDPNNPTQLYAGVHSTTVYRTTTDGTAWEVAATGLPTGGGIEAPQLAIAGSQPATLYYANEGVYQSTDRGTSWQEKSAGLSAYPVAALAVSPADSLNVFIGGQVGDLYYSDTGGREWSLIPLTPTLNIEVSSIVFAPTNWNILYMGTRGDGVFRSADGGATWQAAREGLPMDGSSYFIIEDVKVDPSNFNQALAVIDGGTIYRTVNGGSDWTLVYDHGRAIREVTFATSDPRIVWGATISGLIKSTDGGATWSVPTVTGLPTDANVRVVAINHSISGRVYAGMEGEASALYRSVDGGVTWSPLDTGIPGTARAEVLWIDPSVPQRVLFSANQYDQNGIQIITGYGLRRSVNSGDSWVSETNGLDYPAVRHVGGNASRLYAGMYAAGVWRLGDVPMPPTATATVTVPDGSLLYLPLIGRE